jgi:hypothetical protein
LSSFNEKLNNVKDSSIKLVDNLNINTSRIPQNNSAGYVINLADIIASKFQPLLLDLISVIKNQSEGQQLELNKINSTQKQLLQNQTLLLKSKNQIESPLGKIPISLDESIEVFPLALGIGFFLSIYYLQTAISLRNILYKWYIKKDHVKNILNDKKISDMLPLWIDPIQNKSHKFIRLIILVIPFIIFICSWCLIDQYLFPNPLPSSDKEQINIFPGGDKVNQILLNALYIITVILFVSSFIVIIRAIYSN